EAEDATIVNGVVESNHAGFTGRGFVNSDNAVGAAVEWTVSPTAAGTKSLVFRYANGTTTSRPATITINGSTVTTLQFPGTGSWTNWMIQTVSAPLNAGANTVRATATTANGLGNLDSLTDDDGSNSGPISDPIKADPIQSGLGLTLTSFGAQFP